MCDTCGCNVTPGNAHIVDGRLMLDGSNDHLHIDDSLEINLRTYSKRTISRASPKSASVTPSPAA